LSHRTHVSAAVAHYQVDCAGVSGLIGEGIRPRAVARGLWDLKLDIIGPKEMAGGDT
jgi:hypothetical protein